MKRSTKTTKTLSNPVVKPKGIQRFKGSRKMSEITEIQLTSMQKPEKRVLRQYKEMKYAFDKLRAGSTDCLVFSEKDMPKVRSAANYAQKNILVGAKSTIRRLEDGNYACWREE